MTCGGQGEDSMTFAMSQSRQPWRGTFAAVLAILLLAACQNMDDTTGGPKTAIGGLGGAAAGGLLGAALGGGGTGIVAGALLGGLVGGAVGNVLDQNDRRYANQTAQNALEKAPAGKATTWKNPDTGNSGSVTPTRTYQTSNGSYCREYQQEITIDGKPQRSYGTACRQPDGSWKVVNG
jgi:surface antigen